MLAASRPRIEDRLTPREIKPAYVGGVPLLRAAVAGATGALLNAYRSSAGVAVEAYGSEMVPAQAAFNRPAFVNELATSWLPTADERRPHA